MRLEELKFHTSHLHHILIHLRLSFFFDVRSPLRVCFILSNLSNLVADVQFFLVSRFNVKLLFFLIVHGTKLL